MHTRLFLIYFPILYDFLNIRMCLSLLMPRAIREIVSASSVVLSWLFATIKVQQREGLDVKVRIRGICGLQNCHGSAGGCVICGFLTSKWSRVNLVVKWLQFSTWRGRRLLCICSVCCLMSMSIVPCEEERV